MIRPIALSVFSLLLVAKAACGETPNGRSPNGRFAVVDVAVEMVAGDDYHYQESHFEIQDNTGRTLVSELSFEDLTFVSSDSSDTHVFGAAYKVVWRADSCFVAIETRTSKFATKPIVFFHQDGEFKRVEMPEYEPYDEEHAGYGTSDNTNRTPLRWRRNGDLVLDITTGYHTRSDGGITGYIATVHFAGSPPVATKGSKTRITNRD